MKKKLDVLARLIRHYILISTTKAESGHPTSSLSATDLMTALLFGGFFRYDLKHPDGPNNDRLIFSKGHASPLFYALFAAAGAVSEEELMELRQFGSPLEGHPTMVFPYTEAATGSLGQGLSVGFGFALNAKYIDKLPYATYVLLGDSEMAEGSVWEALALASHYKLDNLVGILDVNRLGQRGETMDDYDLKTYEKKIRAFGWNTVVIDGHNTKQILDAFKKTQEKNGKPTMIIAKTRKGMGISFLENKNGWHGKALAPEELDVALSELGAVDKDLRGTLRTPKKGNPAQYKPKKVSLEPIPQDQPLATRKAYGRALVSLHPQIPNMVVLDAEVSNSTYAETFKKAYPKRFFEMFIAEQNMVGAAIGLSRRGKKPFVSTFAAFFTRAFDQIRMAAYSEANIVFVGSHAGVSIGEDGASQMGLEDIVLFRSLQDSTVLYPSDAVSTEKLVQAAAEKDGIVYIRTTRMDTPQLYSKKESFRVGGSKVLKKSNADQATIVGAGVTLHEALAAYEMLKDEGISVRVIDLYSIQPIDKQTLWKAADETGAIVVVEDHRPSGGIGEAVMSALAEHATPVHSLAVQKMPKSGTPEELLEYEGISRRAIKKRVKKILEKK
jgi:transketolase